jgi:5'-nucleotidase
MTHRPLILITNDDGVDSPGLHAVAEAVADLGDLLIMAPSAQQTGASRSYPTNIDKTVYPTNIPLKGESHPAYKAWVSPAQAVALAVRELAQHPVALCISGINYGENVGSGTTISGTVGAAMEAACFNIPAIAVSLETPYQYHLSHSAEVNFSAAAHFTRSFAQEILAKGLPASVDLLKIDVPITATPQTAWRTAKISRQRYYQSAPAEPGQSQASKGFSYRVHIDHDVLEPDSDIYVLAVDKLVAVVPMTIDLTAPVVPQEITHFFDGISSSKGQVNGYR